MDPADLLFREAEERTTRYAGGERWSMSTESGEKPGRKAGEAVEEDNEGEIAGVAGVETDEEDTT